MTETPIPDVMCVDMPAVLLRRVASSIKLAKVSL